MDVIFAAWYSFENWPYIAMGLIGLGFVIFVHELGHFLVAKMCGVKCEKFYVGFDPPLKFGWGKASIRLPSALWKKQWGETEYGIGIIPLGGYVKMLGQDDNPSREAEKIREARQADGAKTEGSSGESNYLTDPRSYVAQTVPERMAIISAGVIMNLIFAWIFATIAFSPSFGVPYIRCDVASVIPGEAAYQAGIRPGDRIVEINGVKKPRFKDLRQEVILGDLENGIPITIERASNNGEVESLDYALRPQQSDGRLMRIIGVSPASTLELVAGTVALPGSPAAKVENKLQAGDQIVAVNGESVEDFIAYRAALAKNLGQPVNITFMRPETGESLPIEVGGNFLRRYGLEMQMGPVVAIRPDSPAATAGLKKGDVIQKVDGADVGDPLTLPQRLRKKGGKSITLQVLREGNDVDDARQLTFELTPVPVPWGSDIMGTMEIPSLGIAYKIDETITGVKKGSAAYEADFLPGDRVIAIDLKPANETQATKDRALFPDNKIVTQKIGGPDGVSWVLWLRTVAQSIQEDTGLEVTVLRDGASPKIEVSPATVSNTAILPRGFVFVSETDIMRANNLGEAMAFGWRETKYSMLAV